MTQIDRIIKMAPASEWKFTIGDCSNLTRKPCQHKLWPESQASHVLHDLLIYEAQSPPLCHEPISHDRDYFREQHATVMPHHLMIIEKLWLVESYVTIH